MKKYDKHPDPSGLTYTQIAERLGISRNAIYVMRLQQNEKFKYIYGLDPEFEKGFRRYQAMQQEVTEELQGIYYELEDVRLIHTFSKYLFANGVYGSADAWSSGATRSLFSASVFRMSHIGLIKRIEVIDAYPKFKEENDVKSLVYA